MSGFFCDFSDKEYRELEVAAVNSGLSVKDYFKSVVMSKIKGDICGQDIFDGSGRLSEVEQDVEDDVIDNPMKQDIQFQSKSSGYGLAAKYPHLEILGPKGRLPSTHYSVEIIDVGLTYNKNTGMIPIASYPDHKRTAFNVELLGKFIYAETATMWNKHIMQNWFFADHGWAYDMSCKRLSTLFHLAGITGVEDAPNYTYDGLSRSNLRGLVGLKFDCHILHVGGKNSSKKSNIYWDAIEPYTQHKEEF